MSQFNNPAGVEGTIGRVTEQTNPRRRRPTSRASERFVASSRSTSTTRRPAKPERAPRSAFDAKMRQWRPHLRRFAPVVGLNHAVTLAIVIAIAVIIGIGAGFGVVPATIAGLWLQVNLAPVHMSGVTLGFAPLLPALLIVWVHSRRVKNALGNAVSIRGLRVFTTVGLVVPIIITCIAWLMLWDASKVYSVQPTNFLVAVLSTALVNGAAIVMGMGARVWRALLLRRGLPTWPVEAFRLARQFLLWMCAAGLVVALISMFANFNALRSTYDITTDAMGAVGLTVLSLLYLPNLAVASAAVLMGGEFQIGRGVFSLFAANNVNLPPVPIAAAIPNHELSFGPVAMAIPAVVAVAVVYRYMQQRGYVEAPAYLALTAGVAVAFIAFCLCWLAGGELGLFGLTGAIPWMFALEAAAWLIVPALVMMLWAARAGSRVVEDITDATARSRDKAASDKKEGAGDTTKQPASKRSREEKGMSSGRVVNDSKAETKQPGTAKKLAKDEHVEQEVQDGEKAAGDREQDPEKPESKSTEPKGAEDNEEN